MSKLWYTTWKEMLLLWRDIGGLIILFAMPLLLILTVTTIQDSSFRALGNSRIPILWVDLDGGKWSKEIEGHFRENGVFELLTQQKEGHPFTEEEARNAVFDGRYQLAVVIPPDLSKDLEEKVSQNVATILSDFGLEAENTSNNNPTKRFSKKEVSLYFDPATQQTFKNAVTSGIEKIISTIEVRSVYTAFQKELGAEESNPFDDDEFISFREISPKGNDEHTLLPNSTQHNVPAWTLFAIFFIVVPLSINMVKEKTEGTALRLRTNPVSYLTLLGGKVITYLCVCLLQFGLMLMLGVYFLPMFGLPALEVSGRSLMPLFAIAACSGLAAISFGLLIGTIADTQEQAAPFGATAVVILAAVGGIWVPVFMMPEGMQLISNISPMNWGLTAFYDVLLRNNNWAAIMPELCLLLLFFVIATSISVYYDTKKKAV